MTEPRGHPVPQGICAACSHQILPMGNGRAVVWCKHTGYGGAYAAALGMWTLKGPYPDEQSFMKSISMLLPEYVKAGDSLN